MNKEHFAQYLEYICGLSRLNDGDMAISPYGTKYETFCIGGIKKEGEISSIISTNEKLAWSEFAKSFIDYVQKQDCEKISWRVYPQLRNIKYKDSFDESEVTYFNVFSRFSLEK